MWKSLISYTINKIDLGWMHFKYFFIAKRIFVTRFWWFLTYFSMHKKDNNIIMYVIGLFYHEGQPKLMGSN